MLSRKEGYISVQDVYLLGKISDYLLFLKKEKQKYNLLYIKLCPLQEVEGQDYVENTDKTI